MSSTSESSQPSIVKTLVAGVVALLVVHGLGRFVFTPLLPLLLDDGVFTLPQGASLATWNYLGYLVGALLAVRWYKPRQIQAILPWVLIGNALITLAQGFTADVQWLNFLRLANGITNGVVFVQVPALILEWLVVRGAATRGGLVYLGVGFGLLVSSGLVSGFAPVLEGPARWWPVAAVALPLAIWSTRLLVLLKVPEPPPPAPTSSQGALLDRASVPLFMSYAGAGLGYILPMTFLPVVVTQVLGEGTIWPDVTWLVVALTTLGSAWLWSHLGALLGGKHALLVNYAVQAAGVAAPLVLPNALGMMLCALLVGSTCIGTVLLTQLLARRIHPHQGPRLSAALVALYGLTQLVGPWIAEWWLGQGGTLLASFWFGFAALVWGLCWSFMIPAGQR